MKWFDLLLFRNFLMERWSFIYRRKISLNVYSFVMQLTASGKKMTQPRNHSGFPLSGKSSGNFVLTECQGILLFVRELMFLYGFANETLMICICS